MKPQTDEEITKIFLCWHLHFMFVSFIYCVLIQQTVSFNLKHSSIYSQSPADFASMIFIYDHNLQENNLDILLATDSLNNVILFYLQQMRKCYLNICIFEKTLFEFYILISWRRLYNYLILLYVYCLRHLESV